LLELGREDLLDRSESQDTETVVPVMGEFVEDAASDIGGSDGSVELSQCLDGFGEPRWADACTPAEKRTSLWSPHHGDGLECLAEKGGRGVFPSRLSCLVLSPLLVETLELFALTLESTAFMKMVLVKAPDQSAEVALSVTDVVAMDLAAKSSFGLL